MNFIRGFARVLSTLIFRGSLLMFVAFLVMSLTLGSSLFVKNALTQSGVYNSFSDLVVDALEQSSDPDSESPDQASESFNQLVRQSIADSLPPELIQANIEGIIDATYAWLAGDTDRPEIRVDLRDATVALQNNLSANALAMLESLPPCPDNVANQGNELDVRLSTCIPAGADIVAVSQTFSEQLVTDIGIESENAVFVTDDLPTDSNGLRFYERASHLPDLYDVIKIMPWLSGIAIILFGSLVYLLHTKKQAAIKSIVWSLAAASIVLVIGILGMMLLSNQLQNATSNKTIALQTEGIALLEFTLARINLISGICAAIYALSAMAGFILIRSKRGDEPAQRPDVTEQQPTASLDNQPNTNANNDARKERSL